MNAQGIALKRVWAELPDRPLDESELRSQILKTTNKHPGAWADADATRSSLMLAQALEVSVENGQRIYRRSGKFPEHAPSGPGTAAYDEHTAAMVRARKEQQDRLDAAREDNSLYRREYHEHVALIDERLAARFEEMFDERIDKLLRSVDSKVTVESLRARLEQLRRRAA
jgi:hypothetical protein